MFYTFRTQHSDKNTAPSPSLRESGQNERQLFTVLMLQFNALWAEIHLNDSLYKPDRQCTYNVTLRRFRSIIYFECVCRYSCIYPPPLSSMACRAVPYFSILSHKRHGFQRQGYGK
jgi:hypothetical protein